MKKNFYRLLFLGLAAGLAGQVRPAQAQQVAQYSQYMNNNYLLNPAVAGTEDYIDVKVGFRQQWAGIEGAPRTFYVSANSSLGALYTQRKRSLYDWRRGFHAVGGILLRDETGPTSRTALYGSYTYNLALTRKLRLALGASVGVLQFAIDGGLLRYYNVNTVGITEATRVPDATVGLWLYSPNFFAGVSSSQVFGNQLDVGYSNSANLLTNNRLERHYFATVGVRLPLNDDVSVVPSVLVKYMSPAKPSMDFNLKIRFQETLFLGASYRSDQSYTGMVGVNFSPTASLSYSYDLGGGESDLAQFNNGSHEVILGLKLAKSRKAVCNDRFW